MKTIRQTEQEKAQKTLPDMVAYLAEHEERHTPFMDRWLVLVLEHKTQVYPVRRADGAVGRRLRHGRPSRIIECIESAARFGKEDIWFAKVIA